ncbi:MAG TPA: guanylate kinase [Bacteroidetes bacterium]|nr:guanylate kinase [Bacteroidota bacterium]
MQQTKMKMIVFSAPSGAGKTTIVHRILEERQDLAFSVSACSREKRKNEIHAKDYYFFSPEEFKQLIKEAAFLEWEEVYANNFYGTLKSEVERIWAEGKHVVFDIDVQGGKNLKSKYPENCLAIFIMPPSVEELENRLRNRSTETEESIKKRIQKAKEEISFAPYFDNIIINDNLEKAINECLQSIADFLDK